MRQLDDDRILDCLRDLTDRELQLRLWTGRGSNGEMWTFEEAVCQLYDDTGLGDALDQGCTGYSPEAEGSLRDLLRLLNRVPADASPESQVDHPAMIKARTAAGVALRAVGASLAKQRAG